MPNNGTPKTGEIELNPVAAEINIRKVWGLPKPEAVDHPVHYAGGGIEVIDALEAWKLDFHLGNVVKYIARAGKKGERLEDLKKALWYLKRRIELEEKAD